jgi:signal transduction histidine kinase
MKLLTKTTLYYVTISLFIFFILGIAVYQMVKRLEDRKVNQELNDQRNHFSYDLQNLNAGIQNATIISGGLVQLYPVPQIEQPDIQFTDTLLFDPIHKTYIPYRRLSYHLKIEGGLYKMAIYKSLYESNYLVEQVALIITIATTVFLLAVYFLYRYFFGRIWADFFSTISKMQQFNLSSPEILEFPGSMIIEFNELNQVLKKMIDRISDDFRSLKEFTGNLSHEIQTPLAVIRSKADLLLQDKNSSESQMLLAGEINAETMRLSKLIKALSLFTKLDHHQYSEIEMVDVEKIIKSKIEVFEDFIELRNLIVKFNISNKPMLEMNPELADILFLNLVKNAVRHNVDKGTIDIIMDSETFQIRNTGEIINFEPEVLFNRFSKLSKSSESLGIGLSIVKKICDYYQYQIKYTHANGIHEFIVKF